MSCLCSGGPNCCLGPRSTAAAGPFKCPDCGTWWVGEHRCPPMQGVLTIGNVRLTNTVYCTCPPNRGDNYAGNCPIHDVQTTYTRGMT